VVLIVSGALAAASLFGALALGIVLAAFLEHDRGPSWARGRHPFSLVMVLAALPVGVLMLVPVGPYQAPVYQPVAHQLPWVGATFLIGSVCLLVAELQRQALSVWSVTGRFLIGAAWIAWVLLFLAPFGLFNLVPFYVGFSLVLLLEPVVGPRLPRFDPTTLRARTSLAMAAAIAVPMLLGTGVVSNFEEYVDRRTELDREQAQAAAVAATLGTRLTRMAGLASFLANQAAAASGIPADVYASQDFLGAAVVDPAGEPLWMVGLPANFSLSGSPSWTQGPRGSRITVVAAEAAQRLLAVAQPVAGSRNVAAVVASADQMQAWIAPVIAIGDAHLLVVERTGDVVLEVGARPRLLVLTEAATDAPLAYVRTGGPTPAQLAYTPGGEALVGIDAVPETDWGVISERSATAALTAGRSGRELSFFVLVIVLGLAALVGLVTAEALTSPLERLADAIRQVARSGSSVAVPRSSIREIASLAADFEDMQRQLARREAEERAARADAESARQAAESALRLRDVFLRTLAHDLKAPLASLAWHLQVLQRRVRRGQLNPAELDEGLRVSSLGVAEAMGAIDELSDLTRLAAGAPLPLQREAVDLVALARNIVSAHPQATDHHIYFENPEASLIVHGDPTRLARVLHNLLDNALKYSSSDQPVTVSVRHDDSDGQRWAIVSVRDRGMGIPAADLSHVFDLYHRAENAASIGGEGLGLASVRQLVDLHGGRVEVQSELGVGSLFTVRLPLESRR
jgi:signal transduction histidine kinase